MSNQAYELEVKVRQYEYLQKMAEKYELKDPSKALRCILNFATETPDQEESIFKTIRCPDC